jgi:7-cyano-7-deazaguanine synthase in queuosine biosynthesis
MPTAAVTFGRPPRGKDLVLGPGQNLVTGERQFRERFTDLTTLELDLLNVVAAVFACDLAFKRGERENFIRKIELEVPVVNLASFNAIKRDLLYALYSLTQDAWTLTFTQRIGTPEPALKPSKGKDGKVLLFSGGLDSFAAALQLGDAGHDVQLVSHVTANQVVRGSQEQLFAYLDKNYPKQFDRFAARVGGRNKDSWTFPRDDEREETQRTRSMVFVTLAALTARRYDFHKVVLVAENGQMAIHLPLTAARISAFSTHTAHPEFLAVVAKLLSQLLNFQISIENPFLYSTKGEVVRDVVRSHKKAIPLAISCWKASRVAGAANHCGFCIPCLVRRIAIESNGLKIPEYSRDLFGENVAALESDDVGKRNLMELAEFVCNFEANNSTAQIQRLYPEVANPEVNTIKAIEMYERFAVEARGVFDNYSTLENVLS